MADSFKESFMNFANKGKLEEMMAQMKGISEDSNGASTPASGKNAHMEAAKYGAMEGLMAKMMAEKGRSQSGLRPYLTDPRDDVKEPTAAQLKAVKTVSNARAHATAHAKKVSKTEVVPVVRRIFALNNLFPFI